MINKTFSQLNTERAARRAQYKKAIDEEDWFTIEKIQKKNKSSSSQAGGPAHKESGFKRHQKNTKVFKTLQDAIDYNAKKRS